MTKFSDLELDPRVLQAVVESGYETPTPIQAQAIPPALRGQDVLGIAQTGTGKTAGFTLPMITLLGQGRARARMPRSLVLAPTRELAMQVAKAAMDYGRFVNGLRVATIVGGVPYPAQLSALRAGPLGPRFVARRDTRLAGVRSARTSRARTVGLPIRTPP